jgi:hypothetical protein
MEQLEQRVAILEKQVRWYRILNIVVAGLILLWAGYAFSKVLGLQQEIRRPIAPIQTSRLEIIDEATSRPVCVLRAHDGGGRVEVFS